MSVLRNLMEFARVLTENVWNGVIEGQRPFFLSIERYSASRCSSVHSLRLWLQ